MDIIKFRCDIAPENELWRGCITASHQGVPASEGDVQERVVPTSIMGVPGPGPILIDAFRH